MEAARLHDDRHPLERAGDELAPVTRHARLGEPGDVPIQNPQRVVDLVGEEAEARAEHDRHLRLPASEFLADGLGGLPGHNRMPARVAERKLASVPAIMARKPRRARSCLRSGASAPMPPIWMPIELRLAKPHSAKVAIVKDTGSRLAFIGPRCA